jgi:hypothetical protein
MKNKNQKRRVGTFLCPRGNRCCYSVGTKYVPTLQQLISPCPLAGEGQGRG